MESSLSTGIHRAHETSKARTYGGYNTQPGKHLVYPPCLLIPIWSWEPLLAGEQWSIKPLARYEGGSAAAAGGTAETILLGVRKDHEPRKEASSKEAKEFFFSFLLAETSWSGLPRPANNSSLPRAPPFSLQGIWADVQKNLTGIHYRYPVCYIAHTYSHLKKYHRLVMAKPHLSSQNFNFSPLTFY